jgi:hypothetical protein
MYLRHVLLSATLFAQLAHSQPQAPAPDSTLEVRVTYTGAGVVDSSHKLYVLLWDTPDFAKDDSKLKPLESKAVTTKSAAVQFTKIKKSPAYISLVYDPQGGYTGKIPAPANASIGLYSSEQGIPTPIELKPGQTASITARLDDSTKLKK